MSISTPARVNPRKPRSCNNPLPRTGRHTAPLFAGDTVFAATEEKGCRDLPGRPDLGILDTLLLGHKFEPEEGASHADAPPGWKRTRIFELERSIAVKRRSHYRG
jgi:hypothetical protein